MTAIPPFTLSDRYEVLEEIGRGGHAVVFRARDRVLSRDVAIKVLRSDALSADLLTRFRQEVQVTATLEHAHILHVYDTGEHQGRPYVVMELASGRTLADRLERERQLPIADALQITREVGMALAHAHTHGVVHRDVKPENILLGAGGAILADFGIARLTENATITTVTSTGMIVGTVQYMSPEQLFADRGADGRSDQYALACVLYEMLAGMPPHVAATLEALRMLRMTAGHAPVSSHRPSVPAAVNLAIQTALSPSPADRFRTIEEFLGAMGVSASGEFLAIGASGSHTSSDAARSDARGAASPNTRGLARRLVWPSAFVLAGAAGVFGWIRYGRQDASSPDRERSSVRVVLAHASRDPSDSTSPTARTVAAMAAELSLWTGIETVSPEQANASSVLRLEPSLVLRGDSVQVRVGLRSGSTELRLDTMVRATTLDAPDALAALLVRRALTVHLLTESNDARAVTVAAIVPGAVALPDRSAGALRSYVAGFEALHAGRLDSAAVHFRAASAASTRFGHARFWAAQSAYWIRPANTAAWKSDAERARADGTLRGTDSLLAVALDEMSNMRFPDACAAYRRATEMDAASFAAWYGLGECTRLDSLVVKAPAGYRFRSGLSVAHAAYLRAIEVAPTAKLLDALYAPMIRTTYAVGGWVRPGRVESKQQESVVAMPSLVADSLAFFPLPQQDVERTSERSVPISRELALRKGAALALELTDRWVTRAPQSPVAWVQRSLALELAGRYRVDSTMQSADGALDRAEQLTPAEALRATITVARTRLSLRRGDIAQAVAIARMAIAEARTRSLSPSALATLAPLAAFLGDVITTLQFENGMRSDDPQSPNALLPSALADSLRVFRMRATLGACGGLEAARVALGEQFDAVSAKTERQQFRNRWLLPAFRDAVPCLGPRAISEFPAVEPLDSAYLALSNDDRRSARRILDALPARRTGVSPASISWDRMYLESWALAKTGDTAAASAQLQAALNGIGRMSKFTLDQTAEAAGLRRGMLLLREIAGGRSAPRNATELLWLKRANELLSFTSEERRQ